MKTLAELQAEYGYPILNGKQVNMIREHAVNWNSLDGEIIIRTILKSYPAYLQAANYGYQMTPYHYSLAANLQRNYEKGPNPGMPYGLILLSAPPQTGKSHSVTESFQSWVLIKTNGRCSVLTLGYESTFASRFGRRNREKFNEWAPILSHGRLKLHDKIQATESWETMALDRATETWVSTNGGMNTAGMGGPITGKTGNLVVVDDPIKNMEDAESENKITTNIEYYQSTIETRLLGNPGSLCIVMCTRWVPNDLIGWLRRNRKKFIVGDYNYAAQCTPENKASDPLGREIGEGICPEMNKDAQWAQIIKESYTASQGGHVYSSLFQGEPTDMLGNLFKTENWEEYEIAKGWVPDKFDRIYLSIDATFKDKSTSDFVAMKVGGIREGNDYLRYLVRKHMDLPDTLDKIIKVCKKFPEIDIIYIEDKANGPGIVSVLRKWRRKLKIDEHDFPSVYPLEPSGGKYSRAQTSSAYQRDGHCYIPCEKDAHLLSDPDDFEWEEADVSYTNCFKHELGTFPYAANDDLVDAFSQAINVNIPLLTGEEKIEKKPQRFVRYTEWWPEMWADYKSLKSQEDKNKFIKMHGAPKEWKPKSEGGNFGVV